MPVTGRRYIREERQHLANLLATIDLFSEAAEATSPIAAAATDSSTTLTEFSGPGRIEELKGGNIHRKFQIRLDPPKLRFEHATVSPYMDVELQVSILLGRLKKGPSGYIGGTDAEAEEAMVQDVEAVRQALIHPLNRSRGYAGPIYTIASTERRVVMIKVEPPQYLVNEPLSQEGGGRMVAKIPATLWLRVERESAIAA